MDGRKIFHSCSIGARASIRLRSVRFVHHDLESNNFSSYPSTPKKWKHAYPFAHLVSASEAKPCPVSRLLQFHDRYLAYLIVAREKETFPDFGVESLTYEDRKTIIEVNWTRMKVERMCGERNSEKISEFTGGIRTPRGLLGSIFAGYAPLASPSPYPIIVYFVANYRPYLSHFWGNVNFAIPT